MGKKYHVIVFSPSFPGRLIQYISQDISIRQKKTMAIKDFLIFISLYEKKYINLSPDYHVSILYWVKTSSCKKYKETAHAVWSMVKSKDISMQSGLGWDDNPRHIKGVYSTRSLRHIESSKFINLSLERSNGRCPGV